MGDGVGMGEDGGIEAGVGCSVGFGVFCGATGASCCCWVGGAAEVGGGERVGGTVGGMVGGGVSVGTAVVAASVGVLDV